MSDNNIPMETFQEGFKEVNNIFDTMLTNQTNAASIIVPKEVKAAAMDFYSTINGIINLLIEIFQLSLGLQKDSHNNPIIFDEIKNNPFSIEINYDNIFDPNKKIYMTISGISLYPLFTYFKGYGNKQIQQDYFSKLIHNTKVQLLMVELVEGEMI